MKQYLAELASLTGRAVEANELGSLEHTAAMRKEYASKDVKRPVVRCELPFQDLRSMRFKFFIEELTRANPVPIYVWTSHTLDCGTFVIPSLADINSDFKAQMCDEGVLAFTTSIGNDKLLLDFISTDASEQVVILETGGANWANVIY